MGEETPSSAVDELLVAARRQLVRVGPAEAADLQRSGALLVDIRPVAQRQAHGGIPGALVVERNVLEWRLDPSSPDRLPEADDPDRPVVVVCQEGYASSLAAASLRALGLRRATDLRGGFAAWAAEGLPVSPVSPVRPGPRH
ncbi:MAG TPA: rhodanese-like domain-containing protein [Acidimicrobiales bacterium]|jgi:rhodanese-related sulfurtransferase